MNRQMTGFLAVAALAASFASAHSVRPITPLKAADNQGRNVQNKESMLVKLPRDDSN